MVGQVLILGALVALTQAKAIVTNRCTHPVYLWSVPGKSGVADNLPIGPGKRYEEPWRYGTSVNPGIAIKVSPDENGINEGKSEINFQYSVDPHDASKVWINLNVVRPPPPYGGVVLYTCHGPYRDPYVPTRQCSYTDDIELVLCGTERSTPPHDKTSPDTINDCIGRLHERDTTVQPRQCNGRVIGPKPKHEPKNRKDDNDDVDVNVKVDNSDKHATTVPLKDVMRHEAAKHAPKHADASKKEPLCDLVWKVWPEAECHEEMAEQNARLFYKDNCGKRSIHMFPGADCQKVRQALKKIYPDIDKEPKVTTAVLAERRDLVMCINKAYKLLGPLIGDEDIVYEVMNGLFYDRSYTSDEEICYNNKANATVQPTGHKERRCVKKFCNPKFADANCSDVEDALEELSKDAGYKVDWTSSDDECGHHWARSHNLTHV